MGASRKVLVPVVVFSVVFFGFSYGSSAQTDCTAGIPDIDITPATLVAPPGETAVFTAEVENRDSDNCPVKEFSLSANSDAGFSVSFSPSKVTLAPDDRDSVLMKVAVPSDADVSIDNITAFVTGGGLTRSAQASVDIREEIEECTVKVSSLRFKERNADEFETTFSQDDEVSAFVDVALVGNTASDIVLEMFVDGNLFDSETEPLPANSETTFRFGNRIGTNNFNDNINVEVVATPICDPDEADDVERTIDIRETDDDIDLEFEVGRPSNTVVGREVSSRVFAENNGADRVKINVDAFLCLQGVGCRIEMNCGDSIIFVEDDDTEELICTGAPNRAGVWRVDAHISFEDDDDIERSSNFFVYETEAELAARTPLPPQISRSIEEVDEPEESEKIREVNYVCSGSLRQAVYKTDVDVKVSDVEFCPFGCSQGRCLTTPGSAVREPASVFVEGEEPRPVFTRPEFNPAALDLNSFLDWLKNLLFPQPS